MFRVTRAPSSRAIGLCRRYRFLLLHCHMRNPEKSLTDEQYSLRCATICASHRLLQISSVSVYAKYLSALFSLAAGLNDDFCDSTVSRKMLVTLAVLIHRSNGLSQFRKRSDHVMVVFMHPPGCRSRAFFCHQLSSNVTEKALCRNISI